MPERHRLKVDMDGLEEAFGNSLAEATYYFDLQNGAVIMVTDEIRRSLEEICDGLPEEDEGDAGFEAMVSQSDLQDWEKEDVRKANMVETGLGERFILIPQAGSREGYGDMQDFIETVADRALQDRLENAIKGKGAFRRFGDALRGSPGYREQWFQFRDSRVRECILEWLEEEGIEPELK